MTRQDAQRFTLPRHREFVRDACGPFLSEESLAEVKEGNLTQDLWQHRSDFHFDNCAFEAGLAYYHAQWEEIRVRAASGNRAGALRSFGRLLHLVEDFYSHSNWIELHAPQGVIPLWDMRLSSLPQGIASGTYKLGFPKRCSGSNALSHEQLNKDAPDSARGKQTVQAGALQGQSYYQLAYDAALRHSRTEVERLLRTLEQPAPGASWPVSKDVQPKGGGAMPQRLKVRIDSIWVEKSESYGWFGEPGAEAEWILHIAVHDQYLTWRNDHVRNRKNYTIGWDIIVGPIEAGTNITVATSGYEEDDSSQNDDLPTAQNIHTPEAKWGIGQTHTLSANDSDFSYTLRYSVSVAQTFQVSSIPRSLITTVVGDRRAKRGYHARLAEHELESLFINKAMKDGYRLVSIEGDALFFEGPAPIHAFLQRRFPVSAKTELERFTKAPEAERAPMQ